MIFFILKTIKRFNMFIIGGEIYEDDEIFNIDPYYNNRGDYDTDYEYDDELLDIIPHSIEPITATRLISI
jgi:hypothetical protein